MFFTVTLIGQKRDCLFRDEIGDQIRKKFGRLKWYELRQIPFCARCRCRAERRHLAYLNVFRRLLAFVFARH